MTRGLLLVAALALLPSAAAQGVPSGPAGVHVAWGPDPSTSFTVAWTGPPDAGARVEWGDGAGSAAAAPTPLAGGLVAYRATVQGLAPGTSYAYKAVSGGESDVFNVTTAPASGANYTVLAWGDMGVSGGDEAQSGAPEKNRDLAAAIGPAFQLHAGDISYANGNPLVWEEWTGMIEPYAANVPYMTAVGNHEREPGVLYTQYDARFPMPSKIGERWYAFRYGDGLFVSLDSEKRCAETHDLVPLLTDLPCRAGPNEAQRSFLAATLEAARADAGVKWIVVWHHYAAYSDGPHGSDAGIQEFWTPLYDEYGVDLVIQGHDHFYQRSYPIVGGKVADAGTTYVVAGMAGASFYDFQDGAGSEWSAFRDNTNHGVLRLDFQGTHVLGTFVTVDGEEKDAFALVKDGIGSRQVDPASLRGNATAPPPAPAEPSGGGIPAPAAPAVGAALAALAVLVRRRG